MTRIIDTSIGVILVFISVIVWHFVDVNYLPVVKDWKVTTVDVQDNTILAAGQFNKVKDCQLQTLNFYQRIDDKIYGVPHRFLSLPDATIRSRPTGKQSFNGWLITTVKNEGSIIVVTSHQCNPFWEQRSEFPIYNF